MMMKLQHDASVEDDLLMLKLHHRHDASVEDVLLLRWSINFPPLQKKLRQSNTAAAPYFSVSLFTALVCF